MLSFASWASGASPREPPQDRKPLAPTFTIAAGELGDPLTMVVYGDMRFTDPKETVAAAPNPRRALVAKVAAVHPDLVFLTGDVPWHGGDVNDYRAYTEETSPWQQLHLRIYPVLGNHEFADCEEAVCLENWWQAFPQFRGRRWYSVAVGTSVLGVALDSNASLQSGSEQRIWLEQQIESLPGDVRFVILMLHHPPVADQGLFIVRSNERALARYLSSIAPQSSATFVVCSGHVHNYERFERDGVVYLVSGGGGAKPLRVHHDHSDRYRQGTFPNFHYIRFELRGDHLSAEMVRLEDYAAPSPQVWAVRDRFAIAAKSRQTPK
jgi:3',5'-cyclic AMP phosphodiesterase CpdA